MSNPANIRLLDNTLSNISKMLYYIRTGSQELTSAGLDLLENQVENPGITDLQDSLVELLKAEQRVNAFSSSINQLKTKWQQGELDDSVDIVQVLEDSLKEEELKHDDVANIWEHELMKNFTEQIKAVDENVPLQQGPNASEPGTSAHNTSGDIQATETQSGTKCPITQVEMTEPYKDTVCGHRFEKNAIIAHVKQCQKRRKKAKCPYPGCTNIIQMSHLKDDAVMKRSIHSRRRDGEGTSH
ncbi:E3 SUMO-protein ligase NSE2-like [Styela clava]|uniref:E3 SUMO-protein ligase NSE2-like n=1 Tax=Styela clava TaxID=7725 RepID=UPI001939E589|nr:E3 SUMO-protein ligase NSE2-like [Styela clava]